MTGAFQFTDAFGPEKVVEIYDPDTGLRAVVVVDNVAAGPAIGGIRMATDVTAEECFRLARAMTRKNAMAGLAHGGGKSVIVADPAQPTADKRDLIKAFARAIRDLSDYIPGPDMGTDETAMAWVREVAGRSVGLPRVIGGIPLDEIGATAIGLVAAVEVAAEFSELSIAGADVVVQGFGSVGLHTARMLADRGARLVGVADSRGARAQPDGFDVEALIAHKTGGASVAEFPSGNAIDGDAIVDVPSDIFVPAARPDVLRADNVDRLVTKIVAQGANIPATLEAEARLATRGVLVIPDFVANAGGVICASVEYHGGSESQATAVIDEKVRANVRAVLTAVADRGALPREVANEIAEARIIEAMALRATK